jgi:hypothetical protein
VIENSEHHALWATGKIFPVGEDDRGGSVRRYEAFRSEQGEAWDAMSFHAMRLARATGTDFASVAERQGCAMLFVPLLDREKVLLPGVRPSLNGLIAQIERMYEEDVVPVGLFLLGSERGMHCVLLFNFADGGDVVAVGANATGDEGVVFVYMPGGELMDDETGLVSNRGGVSKYPFSKSKLEESFVVGFNRLCFSLCTELISNRNFRLEYGVSPYSMEVDGDYTVSLMLRRLWGFE